MIGTGRERPHQRPAAGRGRRPRYSRIGQLSARRSAWGAADRPGMAHQEGVIENRPTVHIGGTARLALWQGR